MLTNPALHQFKALLKTASGEVLAQGRASALASLKAIRFESDFVPLYPMGTPMEIVRLFDGGEVHRFWGRVFVSDKTLMKLVSVDDELLPGAELLYCDDLAFAANLRPYPDGDKRRLKRRGADPAEQDKSFPVVLSELTDQQLVFQYDMDQPFREGTRFHIKTDAPLPRLAASVEIDVALYFGQKASYSCHFINLSENDRSRLRAFLWQYVLEHRKLF